MKREVIRFNIRCLVFSKCNYMCARCGKKLQIFKEGSTIDHIIPLSRGGENDSRNMVSMCFKCNRRKGNNLVIPRYYYKFLDEDIILEIEGYFLENRSILSKYKKFWLSFINSLS